MMGLPIHRYHAAHCCSNQFNDAKSVPAPAYSWALVICAALCAMVAFKDMVANQKRIFDKTRGRGVGNDGAEGGYI